MRSESKCGHHHEDAGGPVRGDKPIGLSVQNRSPPKSTNKPAQQISKPRQTSPQPPRARSAAPLSPALLSRPPAVSTTNCRDLAEAPRTHARHRPPDCDAQRPALMPCCHSKDNNLVVQQKCFRALKMPRRYRGRPYLTGRPAFVPPAPGSPLFRLFERGVRWQLNMSPDRHPRKTETPGGPPRFST